MVIMAKQDDHMNVKTRRKLDVDRIRCGLSQTELRRYILENIKEPVVFVNRISECKCLEWTPASLAEDLARVRTRFRFCARASSPEYHFAPKAVVMETDCHYLEGTLVDFYEWLTCENSLGLAFEKYPRKDYSCYADYKYMIELFATCPDKLQQVDWSNLGFPERNGEQSSFWMGSSESFTPCHYDTYGCNLIAQIYGKKRWSLFPASHKDCLYPTRTPYEESSVFSQVNIKNPDHEKFPDFLRAPCYEVILEPGDVLFVPKHWWHFVESMETSISVNTWIEMSTDAYDRLQEGITRALIYPLKTHETENTHNLWINPSMREDDFSFQQNIEYIRHALRQCCLESNLERDAELKDVETKELGTDDFINVMVSPDVIHFISQKLLNVATSRRRTLKD